MSGNTPIQDKLIQQEESSDKFGLTIAVIISIVVAVMTLVKALTDNETTDVAKLFNGLAMATTVILIFTFAGA